MQGILETFFTVTQTLQAAGVPYMVVGSIASMVYGEPRLTHDMDVVVEILPQHARRFAALFPEHEFYCPPLEVITAEIVHRGQFNLIHHESGLKIDMMLRKATAHATCEFERRRLVPFWQGAQVSMASPEDVIIKKLDFYRQGGSQKHLVDIRGIMAQTPVDQAYLDHWIAKLGLSAEWRSTRG